MKLIEQGETACMVTMHPDELAWLVEFVLNPTRSSPLINGEDLGNVSTRGGELIRAMFNNKL